MEDEKQIMKINENLNQTQVIQKNYIKTLKEKSNNFFHKIIIIKFILLPGIIIFFFYLYNSKFCQRNIYSCHQLINKSNIQKIQELYISLNIEHSKYVHLIIKDWKNKRWEVPKDILNQDYFNNKTIHNNKSLFKIEMNNLNQNYYNYSKDFSFILYFEDDYKNNTEYKENSKKIFYIFNSSQNFLFSDNYINFESHLTSDDIFGFGERIHNFKLKEGIYTIWPVSQKNYYDDGKGGKNLYGHQPIALHKTKFKDIWLGFVFLNSNPQDIQIYKKDYETILSHKTIGGIIDYYITVDNSPENVLKNIHYLIGIPVLPPYWSLGNHQCRWGYKNDTQFLNIYKKYKMKKIPIDGMWIDADSMEKYQLFSLNKKKFKKLPIYIDNIIHKDHGYFISILDIGFLYNESNLNNYTRLGDMYNLFIKSGYTGKNLMARVWPGKTVFPDFFNPLIDKLWDKGLDDYYNILKYDGIWLDKNEIGINSIGKCPGEIFNDIEEENKYKNLFKNFNFSYLPGYKNNINII